MPATPIPDFVLTEHARSEMQRRGLTAETVAGILAAPGQRFEDRHGRDVLQSVVTFGEPLREYMIRVFVDVARTPAEVVTAYRTSKVAKYWRRD